MLALLALLLLLDSRNGERHGDGARLYLLKEAKVLVLGQLDAITKGRLSHEEIGLCEIVIRERAYYSLNRNKTLMHLSLRLVVGVVNFIHVFMLSQADVGWDSGADACKNRRLLRQFGKVSQPRSEGDGIKGCMLSQRGKSRGNGEVWNCVR